MREEKVCERDAIRIKNLNNWNSIVLICIICFKAEMKTMIILQGKTRHFLVLAEIIPCISLYAGIILT